MSRLGCIKLLFIFMLSFFTGQVLLGCVTGSLALVAESFHSLSVSICLYVTLYSNKLAKDQVHSSHLSYSWKRVKLLGTLLNGVLLLALSFALFLDAFQRCFEPKVIEKPELVFVAGGISLVMNIISVGTFQESTLVHLKNVVRENSKYLLASTASFASHEEIGTPFSSPFDSLDRCHYEETVPLFLPQFPSQNQPTFQPANPCIDQRDHGVKSKVNYSHHLLNSTFGSIILMISSGIAWGINSKWGLFADLLGGLVIALVYFIISIPVVRKASTILMQGSPNAIPVDLIRGAINEIPGVLSVHEFHLWQLSDATTEASVRVKVINATSYLTIERNVQEILQSYGIHSFTIEPEFMNSYRDVLTRTTKEKVEIPRLASVDDLATLSNRNQYLSVSANSRYEYPSIRIPTPSTKTKLGRDSIIHYYQRQQQQKLDQSHLYPYYPEYRKLTVVGSPQPHRTNSSFF